MSKIDDIDVGWTGREDEKIGLIHLRKLSKDNLIEIILNREIIMDELRLQHMKLLRFLMRKGVDVEEVIKKSER